VVGSDPTGIDRPPGLSRIHRTANGHNQFYDLYQEARQRKGKARELLRASKIQILPQEELETARREMTPEEYDQEFECSWQSAIRGAYTAS
jgi:phage terminase large subunit